MTAIGESCSVGGVRFTDPNGRIETFYFPEDEWDREEILSFVDPAVRGDLETAMDEGGFYDLAMAGVSTPEGEGLEITLKSPQKRFPKHILLMGHETLGGPPSAKEPIHGWCAAMLVMGGVTGTGVATGLVISDKRKSVEDITLLGGAVGALLTGAATIKCLSPPSPPSGPGGGSGGGGKVIRLPERPPSTDAVNHTQMEPLPLWLLPAALVVGAIFYMSGGGLVAQPAGFSLTAGEAKWEI